MKILRSKVRAEVWQTRRKTLVKEKTMARNIAYALALGGLSFVALATAMSPPNLGKTLDAQQQLATDRPYDAEVHNDHGNLLVLAGRHEEAREAYRRAIDIAPGATLARYNLAVLLQQAGQYKQAQAEFQSLLKVDAEHARTYYQLGMLFHSRKQRSKALEHYARAFAYDTGLTFPDVNPHIIDNDLATEAILMSRKYSESPTAEVPRLYGAPDRIADMMLGDDDMPSVKASAHESSMEDESEEAEERAGTAYFRKSEEADHPGRAIELEAGEDSEEEEERRALTSEDLDAGSSVGQVQRPARQAPRRSSAGRPTGRSSQGRGGLAAVRPGGVATGAKATGGSRENADSSARATGSRRSNPSAGAQGRSAPRYRPPSRLSTGRLDLRLLPREPSEQPAAVTATR